MHIYGDLLVSYTKRELPEAQLAAIDAHLSNCLFCAHGLADETVVSTSWERRGWLGRLVRVEPEDAVESPSQDLEIRAA
ncbi:MAG: hypothetical protein ACJ74D_13025 [Gaiellaceae bacterium]